jgi:hypothetical protein
MKTGVVVLEAEFVCSEYDGSRRVFIHIELRSARTVELHRQTIRHFCGRILALSFLLEWYILDNVYHGLH